MTVNAILDVAMSGRCDSPAAIAGIGDDGILVFGQPEDQGVSFTIYGETKTTILSHKTLIPTNSEILCSDISGVESLSFATICGPGVSYRFHVNGNWCSGGDGLSATYVWLDNVDTFTKPEVYFSFRNYRSWTAQHREVFVNLPIIDRTTPGKYEVCGQGIEVLMRGSRNEPAYRKKLTGCDVYELVALQLITESNGKFRLLK